MSDLIDRQAAIDAIRASTSKYTGFMEMEMYTDDDAVEAIEGLPAAQPEWKRGKWEIYVISMFDGEGCRCSECGLEGVPYWDFCPNCGADMREVDE